MRVESFVFFTSWLEAIEDLDDEDQNSALRAILRYQAYHEEPDIKGAARAVFKMAQPIVDDIYSRRLASIENGKRGGRPKTAQSAESEDKAGGNSKPKKNLEKPSHNLDKTPGFSEKNLNDNENDNGNENENGNVKKKRFTPPSFSEVKAYCQERNNGVDPQRFYDYYSTGGWKDGKGNPIINWKQKMIAVWEKQKNDDVMPVYVPSNNAKLSDHELNELLALRKGDNEQSNPNRQDRQ